MKRFSLSNIVVAATCAFVLVWGGGCTTGPGAKLNPRQQMLLDTVDKFHRLARTDGEVALKRYQTPESAGQFETALGALEGHWVDVFRPSVYGVRFFGSDEALVLFYNPWSDIGFIALWQPVGQTFGITDAELVPGDCIRKRGVPPFKLLRHWRRTDEAPLLAVCESAYQTLEAFRQTFSRSKDKPPPAQWRTRLPVLQNAELREGCILGAGMMLSITIDGLRDYRHDEKLSPVRKATAAALAQLRRGDLAEVLRSADETGKSTREELAGEMPDKWGGMQIVATLDLEGRTFVFLDSSDQAGLFVSFFFRKASGRADLKRIDVMNFWMYSAAKSRR